MAKQLQPRFSPQKQLNIVRRHKRLCRQVKGAEKYSAAIDPAYSEALSRNKVCLEKVEAREDALDDSILFDTILDGALKTDFEKTGQHHRDFPMEQVIAKTFTDGKFTTITNAPRATEPDLVDQLAVRFEALGTEHVLYPIAAELRLKAADSRSAMERYRQSIRDQKLAEAEEEIALLELRRQYEHNYLDARKEFGRDACERLFPTFDSPSSGEEGPTDEKKA